MMIMTKIPLFSLFRPEKLLFMDSFFSIIFLGYFFLPFSNGPHHHFSLWRLICDWINRRGQFQIVTKAQTQIMFLIIRY
jgi:hypothetical protein